MRDCENCRESCGNSAKGERSIGSYSVEWSTPSDLFADLDAEFHFDIDVAAAHDNHLVSKYYTKEDDALCKEWTGTCWMNPPWTGRGDMKKWVRKAYESKALVVCLLPKNEASGWWRDYCTKVEVRETGGQFLGCNNAKKKKGAIVIFPPNYDVLPLLRRNPQTCPGERGGRRWE